MKETNETLPLNNIPKLGVVVESNFNFHHICLDLMYRDIKTVIVKDQSNPFKNEPMGINPEVLNRFAPNMDLIKVISFFYPNRRERRKRSRNK